MGARLSDESEEFQCSGESEVLVGWGFQMGMVIVSSTFWVIFYVWLIFLGIPDWFVWILAVYLDWKFGKWMGHQSERTPSLIRFFRCLLMGDKGGAAI
ncbi:hypothetical protein Scep_019982 [Stephania cephalantha]|uniref:Uncharacterized protein n=1 Tax=Stephania cephalantha TaxID=152367 RepID=A0AAP0NMQ2_9MAGN